MSFKGFFFSRRHWGRCPWCSNLTACRVSWKVAFIWVHRWQVYLFVLPWYWFKIFWRKCLRRLLGDGTTCRSWVTRRYHWWFWIILFLVRLFFKVPWIGFCWNWQIWLYYCFRLFRVIRVQGCYYGFSCLLLLFLGKIISFCILLLKSVSLP